MKKMWKNLLGLLLIFTTFSGIGITPAAAQGSYDDYIYEYLVPQNISPDASDLAARLTTEVEKVIDAGHLAPFRTIYGETRTQHFWYTRYDTVYTLSLAYPYLDADLQARVQTYLRSEMQTYPLWNGNLLDPNVGTRREPDEISASERGGLNGEYNNRPKLFAMYALWLYAENTGDWDYINNNWNSIVSFYNGKPGEVTDYYSSIAGAIGVARMAHETGHTSVRDQVVNNVVNGFNSGQNFNDFAKNAEDAYKWVGDGWDNWTRSQVFLGFQFLDITPEIGRYFSDNASLKADVLGSNAYLNEYSLVRGEAMFPLWYMAQPPAWTRYYGESASMPPDTRAMIFPLHAWVLDDSPEQLRIYVDVPDALIGDYYYMQNLVRAIEAYGSPCWEDVTTTQTECTASTLPTPTPGPSPTPPVAGVPGDGNGDGKVNLLDFVIWLEHYDEATSSGAAEGDFNGDGTVDGLDYVIWVNNH
ncbi:MAG: hypothetical protein JXB38_10335 [Anaerolineales bacterium]|nr:hypothetical protein [Anaerolineales bacterium]